VVSTQAALLDVIAHIQEGRALGVLLITHDRVLADAWCEDVVDIRALTSYDRPQQPAGAPLAVADT
jgi:ABC-type dipeptide/oligopeptide/nickel transport system ATPase component